MDAKITRRFTGVLMAEKLVKSSDPKIREAQKGVRNQQKKALKAYLKGDSTYRFGFKTTTGEPNIFFTPQKYSNRSITN